MKFDLSELLNAVNDVDSEKVARRFILDPDINTTAGEFRDILNSMPDDTIITVGNQENELAVANNAYNNAKFVCNDDPDVMMTPEERNYESYLPESIKNTLADMRRNNVYIAENLSKDIAGVVYNSAMNVLEYNTVAHAHMANQYVDEMHNMCVIIKEQMDK